MQKLSKAIYILRYGLGKEPSFLVIRIWVIPLAGKPGVLEGLKIIVLLTQALVAFDDTIITPNLTVFTGPNKFKFVGVVMLVGWAPRLLEGLFTP
jgi:hypothetical protein